jgi:hypothetical protein
MQKYRIGLIITICLLHFASVSAQVKAVTFEDFGCAGDGQDETAKILNAFQFARSNKLPIKLLGKTYIFSPGNTVDITGIPLIYGSGRMDLSKTGRAGGYDKMFAVFHVQGEKRLLQKGVAGLSRGNKVIKLNPGLGLKKGETIFITSAEPLGNLKREYYCKGQRSVIVSYDNGSGATTLDQPIFYTITSASIWLHSSIPEIKVDRNIEFVTAPMNFITCFRLYYAKGKISGKYKNFALTAVMFKSSEGVVEEMEAELPVNDNNGYSHCIEVADMSSVKIKNCRLSGGRHVISGVGGGLWEKEESGGKGHAGYPSVLEVDGGTYKGVIKANNITEHNATIDSHGIVERMVIKNCTIYGGINLGANFVLVDNVTIYTDHKRILNVGSDVEANAEWGNYIISNCVFIGESGSTISLIYAKANVESLTLKNIMVKNMSEKSYLIDFRYFTPRRLEIDKVKLDRIQNRSIIITHKKQKIKIVDSDFDLKYVKWMD